MTIAATALLYFLSGSLLISANGTARAPIGKLEEGSKIPPTASEITCSAWLKHYIPPSEDQFSPSQRRFARPCSILNNYIIAHGAAGEKIEFEIRVVRCDRACEKQLKEWRDS